MVTLDREERHNAIDDDTRSPLLRADVLAQQGSVLPHAETQLLTGAGHCRSSNAPTTSPPAC